MNYQNQQTDIRKNSEILQKRISQEEVKSQKAATSNNLKDGPRCHFEIVKVLSGDDELDRDIPGIFDNEFDQKNQQIILENKQRLQQKEEQFYQSMQLQIQKLLY